MSLLLQRIHKTVVYDENDVFSRYFKSFCIFNDYVYTISSVYPSALLYLYIINHDFIMRRSIHQLFGIESMSPSYINWKSRHQYFTIQQQHCALSRTLFLRNT